MRGFRSRNISTFLDGFMKWSIEVGDHGVPLFFSVGDFIEFFFNFGGKVVVNDISKVFDEKIIHNHSGIGWEEFIFFRSGDFCFFFFSMLPFFKANNR
jgi:hypothetical protein